MTIDSLKILPRSSWLKTLFSDYLAGKRLSEEHLLRLLLIEDPADVQAIHAFADLIREQKVGNTVYYSSTLYLYPTNICHFNCTFCSYYAKPGDPKGWFFTPDELIAQIHQTKQPITEVHIVAGCYPDCDLSYYQELLSKIRANFPDLHIKALSAVEYAYLANLHQTPVQNIFLALKDAGLDSIPGGGAEILVDEVRRYLAPNRLSSEEYLNIHRTAHQLGIPSNTTILCYHRETPADIVTHMSKIRDLQGETSGFKNFILLKFADQNNALGNRIRKQSLRAHHILPATIIAAARLFLDNFYHIKALWNYLGIDEALRCLSSGANDLSSTHIGERVFQMASSGETIKMDQAGMESLILKQGRIPCLTNSKNV